MCTRAYSQYNQGQKSGYYLGQGLGNIYSRSIELCVKNIKNILQA